MAKKKDQPEALTPLELQPWRVLAIAAHPDDLEYAASAAVAKWTSEGAEVVYLIASRGETGIPGIDPEQAALIRSGEQAASAAVVGVNTIDFLDVNDGTIEPTVSLRRAMVGDIRRFKPDVVMLVNHREQWQDGSHNTADHRAVGIAALDAIENAANQWVFRDIGKPHKVDIALVVDSPDATHGIDVTGFEQKAVDALATHEQHLAAIDDHPMADPTWLPNALKQTAAQLAPAEAAIAVEVFNFAKGRPCHSSIVTEVAGAKDDGPRSMRLKVRAEQSPARSRNAAPHKSASKKTASTRKSGSERKNDTPAQPTLDTIRFKARMEQTGKTTTGIEIPENVVTRLGGGKRPTVTVEVNSLKFDAGLGTTGGRRVVSFNAERRKAAELNVDDTFFVTISLAGKATEEAVEAKPAKKAGTRSRRSSAKPKAKPASD